MTRVPSHSGMPSAPDLITHINKKPRVREGSGRLLLRLDSNQ